MNDYNNYNQEYYENDLDNYYDYMNNHNKKPIYNIDLFTGVKEEFDKGIDIDNTNNLYLNFYNKHTKNKVLQDETDISKKFYDSNLEYIKSKEYKYKKKQEEIEKIKKKKEREDSNEYRKQQMQKLYSNQLKSYEKQLKNHNKKYSNVKPRLYNNKSIPKPKITIPEQPQIIPKCFKKREMSNPKKFDYGIKKSNDKHKKIIPLGSEVVMTKKEYDKQIKEMVELLEGYLQEKNNLPMGGGIHNFERQIELGQLIDRTKKNIDKYRKKVGIRIINTEY